MGAQKNRLNETALLRLKKFCLTKPMGALWKFFAIKLVAFVCFYGLPIYILDPDWDRINFGPDLYPSCLKLL